MPRIITPQELANRIEDLARKPTLTADETRELQDLARQAADLVCAVETVKQETHGGRD